MMMKQIGMTLCFVVIMALTGTAAVRSQALIDTAAEADSIIAHVRETLAGLETMQCSVEQVYHREVDGWNSVIRGTLALKEPSRFRYEDTNQLFIADGVTSWVYVPANEQVNISVFRSEDEEFPTPKNLFRRYTEGRTASYEGSEVIDGRPLDILVLPAANADESDVKVWVDRELACPVITLEEYPRGDTVQYIVRDLRLNIPLADSLFVFEVPPGVDVIDLRD